MDNLQAYFNNIQQPWSKLFYKIIWDQFSFVKSMNVLDFGSGFGVTANYLASHNNVTAIEPNQKMLDMRVQENKYEQIAGGLEQLQQFPDNHFDFIVCHNVLEYIDDKDKYINSFYRVLNKSGILSLVKHNHSGRIMQRAVFENNLDLAIEELEGHATISQSFGEIKYYSNDDIFKWAEDYSLIIEENLGIRSFFGLVQDNNIKYDEAWQEKMLELELKAGKLEEFKNIAFYNHILMSK